MPDKKNEYPPEKLLEEMQRLLGPDSPRIFNEKDVEALRSVVDKINSLSEKERIAILHMFSKAETVGKVVTAFEAIDGFIRTANYLKNMAWLLGAVVLLVLWSQGKLNSLFDFMSKIGGGGSQ